MEVFSIVIVAVCIFVFCIAFVSAFVDNKTVVYEPFALGEGVRKIRVAHLSDLHFPKQAVDTERLLSELKQREIDFVAITGDLMGRRSDIFTCGALEFARELAAICPVYYVRGNHETEHRHGDLFVEELKKLGVHVVEGSAALFEKDDVKIAVAGVGDGAAFSPTQIPAEWAADYTLLLAHHPERKRWRGYTGGALSPDLVLAGHAHGGQFRMFGMGAFAPDQGLFPRVAAGRRRISDRTELIVSRGIGRSEFPLRLNNPPHVPVIEITI